MSFGAIGLWLGESRGLVIRPRRFRALCAFHSAGLVQPDAWLAAAMFALVGPAFFLRELHSPCARFASPSIKG